MSKMIFVNLPVADLARSIAFYEAVGFVRDDRFCDGTAQMMTWSENIHVMLLTHEKFASFISKTIVDAQASAQAFFALSVESRAEVDAIVDRAVAAGGTADPSPVDDMGFMYGRGYEDPDGHMTGINWMDVAAMTAAMQREPA
ncbi:VOC family protein [Sphingomonas crocodyli]|uniref:Lactoylglutathione lyase n=1 Tax=Sphingomonas crocodyli TaxID=1979270 RepID=A0A437M9X6_9SPHN|nr:VOC family protein [Sphingomonas crocodyli]RVT94439.1 lactoylglutathione lyase [Sphingomonas crocodyli]